MNISNSTIYVIGIDRGFLLIDVYDSIEEAIDDIESPDKCHTAFQYATKGHTVRVYKTTMCDLHRFYKEFAIHEIPDPKRYFDVYLTQVYPEPSNDYSLEDLKQPDECHNNDLHICPIYGVMMSHAAKHSN